MTDRPVDSCDLLCLDLAHAEAIRTSLPELAGVQSAASAAKALSDPTRLMIATALSNGEELCVCDLAWVVGSAQNLVSHHLQQLKNAALVTSRRNGKLVMYRMTQLGAQLTAAVHASIRIDEVEHSLMRDDALSNRGDLIPDR